jgi:hemerythrin-like domain-containing protein
MKTATENLENDHVNILRLIDVMERMVSIKSINAEHFEEVVNLIKNYADGFHHAKEENLLFPLMVTKGFSAQYGPVAVMLHEHDQGREYVKGMTEGIALYKEGDEGAVSMIYRNMLGYISLLRDHIEKENNILFRMADQSLSGSDQEGLLTEFSKIENGRHCGGTVSDCITAINKLEEAYR